MDNSSANPPLSRADCMAMEQCSWTLPADAVHLWRIDLAMAGAPQEQHLSADERIRAERFRNRVDRARFIARRQILRELLARYGDVHPSAIRFTLNDYGKPTARDTRDVPFIEFSSSSRGRLILIALARSPLGIDVEEIRTDVEIDPLVSAFFHPEEAVDIKRYQGRQKLIRFYHCWSRKEAYIKAVGQGLDLRLSDFRVTVEPDGAELLWRDEAIGDETNWTIRPLAMDDGYVGALVQSARHPHVQCFDFAASALNDQPRC